MGALREKLHEERGASMLMALLLLLVALMVSAVVIAAASSAATTLRSDRAQEQAALSVTSAAEYVRDAFQNGEMDGTISTARTGGATYTLTRSGGAFSSFVKNAVPQVYNNANAPAQQATFRLSVADEAVEDVWADFALSFGKDENSEYPTYVLTVTLRNYETVPGEHPCSTVLLLYSNKTSRFDYSSWSYVDDVTWNGYSTIQR